MSTKKYLLLGSLLCLIGLLASGCNPPEIVVEPTSPLISTSVPSTNTITPSGPGGTLEVCLQADFTAAQTFADYLTSQDLDAWSPDGRTLAYVSTTEHSAEFPVELRFTPGKPFNILEVLATGEVNNLAWSPDGSRLALSVFRKEDQLFTILVASADGSDIQDLMPGEEARTDPGVGTKHIHSWWDESNLLILTNCGTGCQRPFLLNLRDSKQTPFFELGQEGEYYGVEYTWSPDKKWGVVLSGASPRLGIAPGEGGKIAWLSPDGEDSFSFSPSWAPDSSRFVFLRQPGDTSRPPELWLWEVQSGEAVHLLDGVASAVWSPLSEDGIVVLTLGQPHLAQDGSWGGVSASPDGPNVLGIGVYSINSAKMVVFEEIGELELGYPQPDQFLTRLLPPRWSPDGWRIAYRDADKSPWALSVGYGQANLETNGDLVTGFEWSPDGAMLSVKTENRLWVYAVPCSDTAPPLPSLTPTPGPTITPTPVPAQFSDTENVFTIANDEPSSGLAGEPPPDWLGWGAQALTLGPDGSFWLLDTAAAHPSRLLQFSPEGDLLKEIPLDGIVVGAVDVAVTGDKIWVLGIASQPPKIVEFNGNGVLVAEFPIQTPSYPYNLWLSEGGELWVTEPTLPTPYQFLDAHGEVAVEHLKGFSYGGRLYQILSSTVVSVDEVQIEITAATPSGRVGWVDFLGAAPDGSFFVAVTEEQMENGVTTGYVRVIQSYSPTGEPLGVNRPPDNAVFVDFNRDLAVGPDGALYALVSREDHSVDILRLGFTPELPVLAETNLTPAPSPTPLTPLQPGWSTPPAGATDLEIARETLVAFFTSLHDGLYTEAAPLFGGSYENFVAGVEPDPVTDPEGFWEYVCGIHLCLQVAQITEAEQISEDTFRFVVEFMWDDGTRFHLGPCCGATEADMPPVWLFPYTVKKMDGQMQVMEPPVYVP